MTDKLWFFSPFFFFFFIKEAKVVKETDTFFVVEKNLWGFCEQVKIRKDSMSMMGITRNQRYFLTREEAIDDAVKYYTKRIADKKEEINKINEEIDADKCLLKDNFGVEVE